MVKVKLPGWIVEATAPVETADRGINRFVGGTSFSSDFSKVFVPRPFSRDVVTLDTNTLSVVGGIAFSCQPIDAFVGKRVAVARDWHTGQFEFRALDGVDGAA